MTNIIRYLPQIIIPEIGNEGQLKIAAAKVLVVGAGGLGCPALQYLAALGVGQIGIIDDDTVSKSNMQRQILYTEDDIGKVKAVVASQRLAKLNSEIEIVTIAERITAENAMVHVKTYDIVIDCSDNIETRYVIDVATSRLQMPFVYGGVKRFEGQVSVFNYKDGPSFSNIFPNKKIFENELDCASAGIVGYASGMVGCLQVNEVLKIILGKQPLSGYLLTIDLQTMVMRKWKLQGG